MNLLQMQNYLLNNFNQNGYYLGNPNNLQFHAVQMNVQCQLNANINVSFPGYKSVGNTYDYLVELNKNGMLWKVSHEDIMRDIYMVVSQNNQLGPIIEQLLSDISRYWENINVNNYSRLVFPNFSVEEFIECICYISTQEEINYPRSKGYDGYMRPFYSYLEAVYSAYNQPLVTINNAITRCNAKKRFTPIQGIPYGNI